MRLQPFDTGGSMVSQLYKLLQREHRYRMVMTLHVVHWLRVYEHRYQMNYGCDVCKLLDNLRIQENFVG